MRQYIEVSKNNKYATFGGETFLLDDFIVQIGTDAIRADRVVQMILDYQNKPNQFSIYRKLSKQKYEAEQIKKLADKLKI